MNIDLDLLARTEALEDTIKCRIDPQCVVFSVQEADLDERLHELERKLEDMKERLLALSMQTLL